MSIGLLFEQTESSYTDIPLARVCLTSSCVSLLSIITYSDARRSTEPVRGGGGCYVGHSDRREAQTRWRGEDNKLASDL